MINTDEFVSLRPGDRVRIVSEWGEHTCENSMGLMDKWLGQIMTVREVLDRHNVGMEEDIGDRDVSGRGWWWNRFCIEEIVEEREVELASDDELAALLEI